MAATKEQIAQLEGTIAHLKAQRSILGDAAVEVALSALRQQLFDLLAIERYTGSRVHDVYRWARRDSAGFRIFSGVFGLLRASDPILWYDHALQLEEVSEMAARVAGQIEEQGLRKLVVYTAEVDEHPRELIYLGCLQVAAGAVGGVTVEHRQVSDVDW